jgi:hypothetical protein
MARRGRFTYHGGATRRPIPKGQSMTMKPFFRAAAAAAAIGCLVVGAARAADDGEKECDDIMAELKKLTERHMNTAEPKGLGPVCAATGQLLGIMKASREVAAECYADGTKLNQILLSFDKGIKDIEGKVDAACK